MSDVSWALQQAIWARLDTEIATPVYDHVPEGSPYPYVVIGDEAAGKLDTLTDDHSERFITLTVFSDYEGQKEVKQILQALRDALHRYRPTLSVGVLASPILIERADTARDADGRTFMGSATLKAVTSP